MQVFRVYEPYRQPGYDQVPVGCPPREVEFAKCDVDLKLVASIREKCDAIVTKFLEEAEPKQQQLPAPQPIRRARPCRQLYGQRHTHNTTVFAPSVHLHMNQSNYQGSGYGLPGYPAPAPYSSGIRPVPVPLRPFNNFPGQPAQAQPAQNNEEEKQKSYVLEGAGFGAYLAYFIYQTAKTLPVYMKARKELQNFNKAAILWKPEGNYYNKNLIEKFDEIVVLTKEILKFRKDSHFAKMVFSMGSLFSGALGLSGAVLATDTTIKGVVLFGMTSGCLGVLMMKTAFVSGVVFACIGLWNYASSVGYDEPKEIKDLQTKINAFKGIQDQEVIEQKQRKGELEKKRALSEEEERLRREEAVRRALGDQPPAYQPPAYQPPPSYFSVCSNQGLVAPSAPPKDEPQDF